MSFPKDFMYTKEHEWLKIEGNKGTVGITAFAVEQLGDVVHVDFPKVGQVCKQGDSFGSVESTKTVSDLYMPVACKIVEINSDLKDAPEKLAEDPHGKYWLVKVELTGQPSGLLDAAAYEKYLADEAH